MAKELSRFGKKEPSFIDSPEVLKFETNPVCETAGRRLLPTPHAIFQHPIVDEALYYDRFITAHDPSREVLPPDSLHFIKTRAGTVLDWCESITTPDHPDHFSSIHSIIPAPPNFTNHLFPRYEGRLAAFCMVDGKMLFIPSDEQTIVTCKIIPPPIVDLIDDSDLLSTHVSMNHRNRHNHPKEVFPRKVVQQRLIRRERMASFRRKLP